jgi:membrane protein implicated in regulation of membrane protease activity
MLLFSSSWLLDLFLNNVWLAIGVWVGLSCLDYIFTMTAARFYRDGAQQHYVFAEGIELNPFFREDVAKISKISFRFLLSLFFSVGLLLIVYELDIPEAFAFIWGMLVGIHLANHCRHIRNLVVFSYARRSNGVSGKIQYEYWFSLRLSAVDFCCFGMLFLLLFLIWGHLVVLGATAGCLSLALRHFIDSIKKQKSLPKTEKSVPSA